jgi:hypothetical protein
LHLVKRDDFLLAHLLNTESGFFVNILYGPNETVSEVMASTDDDIVYAIRISPHGAALMCAAAGITPPEWEDREWAEVDVQRQTRSLTK